MADAIDSLDALTSSDSKAVGDGSNSFGFVIFVFLSKRWHGLVVRCTSCSYVILVTR